MSGQAQQYTVLRTIRGASLPEMVEDLNANFSQILNIYATKGMPGSDGMPGGIGGSGSRGASFMILNITEFQNNFSSPVDPNEITLDDINNALIQNSILFFEKCTNFDDLVHNDMLILPNGKVIQYNANTGLFVATTLRLFNNTDVWTKEQIIQLIEEYSQTSEGLYKAYTAQNKVVADDVPGAENINTVFNPNSVADIATLNSGPGYESTNMIFLAPQETTGVIQDNRVPMMAIDGHAVDYHQLVQNSIAQSKLKSVPKAESLPARGLIQNQPSSGFIFGATSANTLDKFAHIRKNTNALEIMPYYTNDGDFINANTMLSVSDNTILGRSNNVIFNTINNMIDLQVAGVSKVNVNKDRTLVNGPLFVDSIKSSAQNVVTVLPTGQLQSVLYKPAGTLNSTGSALPVESVIAQYVKEYVQAKLGWNGPETVKYFLDLINQNLAQVNTDLTVLNTIAGAFIGPKGAVLAYRGAVIPAGWQIVTDLRGRTVVGLNPNDIDFNVLGAKNGNSRIVQTLAQMPKHSHRFRKGTEKVGNGNNNGMSVHENAAYPFDTYTSEQGGNEAMYIMNPHEVVNFIELIS